MRLSYELSSEGHTAALFQGADPATLFAGTPVVASLVGTDLTLSGLTNGTLLYFGMALRESPSDPYRPVGAVLSARPGDPIFVDPNANPIGADGLTPATAYPDPVLAMIDSFGLGGANVYLMEGDYPPSSLPVFGGTHLFGGFDAGFALAARDPELHPTTLHGLANQAMAAVQGLSGVVIDGIAFEGDGLATHGIDMDSTPLELRGVSVNACTQRGVRVRAGETADPTAVTLVDCQLTQNGSGGLSGLGNLDVVAVASSFVGNGQEGLDLDDLVARDGGAASLVVDACSFVGNATDGLDVDLNAPVLGGTIGGELDVTVLRSSFVGNGEVGLLIDVDYILAPLWKADIAVRGCRFQDNNKQGVLVDADERANVFIERSVAEANGLAGFEVTSSLVGGLALISHSAALGNHGPGFSSPVGEVELLVTHSLAAGNVGGGFTASGNGQVSSSASLLQPSAFLGTINHDSPDLGNNSAAFVRAPEAFVEAGSVVSGSLAVPSSAVFGGGELVEVAGDGVARTATVTSATVIELDPAPADRAGPTSLMLFGPGSDVDLDLALAPGSPLVGAGLQGLVDAGPEGLAELGELPPLGLHLKATAPTLDQGLGATASLLLRFEGGSPSASSVASAISVHDGTGNAVPFNVVPSGADWSLVPAGPDWNPTGSGRIVVELLPGLDSSAGAVHSAPLALQVSLN